MRCAAFSLLALLFVTTSFGCHRLNRRAAQGENPYACADGGQVEAPYAFSDECADCQTDGEYACADGSCRSGRSRGLMQAIGQAFHRHGRRHHPQAPVGGPPVGTVTYPYYTVRGPRDFLANDPPNIGPY
jgi:hypothetical protein